MLDQLAQARLVQATHMRLPQDFGDPRALDVEVQLRVVLLALRVVCVERVIGRETTDVGVQELVLAQGPTLGGVVDREGRVVLEQARLDLLEKQLLFLFVIRIVCVPLSSLHCH